MDIGWGIAYKGAVPHRGVVNGGMKSHGEETEEGQENLREKAAPDTYGKALARAGAFPSYHGPCIGHLN